MIVTARHAQPDDIYLIAQRMRRDDRNEVMASHGLMPEAAMRISYQTSSWIRTGTIDGEPFCMFGVCPLSALSTVAAPWLLGTDRIREVKREFLRHNLELIPEMSKGFCRLENWVDVRNTMSVRWLKWLGFAIMPPEPFGVFGLPFHRFTMEV